MKSSSRYSIHNDEEDESAPPRHSAVDVNDVHPYPTSSGLPKKRSFLQETMSTFQLLGFAIGGFVSIAANTAETATLSSKPWMVGFILLVLSACVEVAVISQRGITVGTCCCNWKESGEFRGAVVDVTIILLGFIGGLLLDSALPLTSEGDTPRIGGAILGGASLGILLAVLTVQWLCKGKGAS